MKTLNYLLLILNLVINQSCFKTAEEVAKERQQEIQISQSQEVVANLTTQSLEIQERVNSFNGRLEELEYKQKQDLEQLKKDVEGLQTRQDQIDQQLKEIKNSQKEQNKFIKEITKSLKNIGASAKKAKKKESSKYFAAMGYFKKKQYSKAKKAYVDLLESGNLNAARTNRVLHKLGIIEYQNKEYQDALVYLSKVYTKYPRSSVSPDCLYYIAMSFKQMGNKEAAKQSLVEFQQKYPRSDKLSLVKKELAAL